MQFTLVPERRDPEEKMDKCGQLNGREAVGMVLYQALLCSKHFKEDCFMTEGVRFCDALGIPVQKCLKADAVPTIFARIVDQLDAGSSSCTPSSPPLSEKRVQRSVSV